MQAGNTKGTKSSKSAKSSSKSASAPRLTLRSDPIPPEELADRALAELAVKFKTNEYNKSDIGIYRERFMAGFDKLLEVACETKAGAGAGSGSAAGGPTDVADDPRPGGKRKQRPAGAATQGASQRLKIEHPTNLGAGAGAGAGGGSGAVASAAKSLPTAQSAAAAIGKFSSIHSRQEVAAPATARSQETPPVDSPLSKSEEDRIFIRGRSRNEI